MPDPRILIRNPSGKILFRGGGIAIGPNQCCSPCECGGCSGGSPPTLLAEIDASGAFGNPLMIGGMGCGGDPACYCYGCGLVGGTYAMTQGIASSEGIPPGPTSCHWGGTFDAPGYQAVCNGDQSDNGTSTTKVYLVVYYDSGSYFAYLNIEFAAVGTYIWFKYLGTTKPSCASLFPMTFGQAESSQQEFFDAFGYVVEPCDLRFLNITVDLP